MSNKINKRLILYQAPRHQEYYKPSQKQGFCLSQISYSASKKTQKYFAKIHNRAQIRKLSYSLESAQSNKTFMLLASALTNVKTLCLTINIPDVEKYRKIIKKLFLRKKRITAIKLILKDQLKHRTSYLLTVQDAETKLTFPWKALGILKELASLKIIMQFKNVFPLRSLYNFFKHHRKPLPKIKSQHIFLQLQTHLRFNLGNFQFTLEKLEAEARKHSPCKLGFDLCGSSPSTSDLRNLCSILDNVQSLASMKLDGDLLLGYEGDILMKSLAKAQQLEELSWIVFPTKYKEITDLLPETLANLTAFKKLQLDVTNGAMGHLIDEFLLGLRRVSRLQCLSLSFSQSHRTLCSSLVILGESFGKMLNLQDFTIVCQELCANTLMWDDDLLFDLASVNSLFERIRECKNLERLCLDFYGRARQISNREFSELCGSLRSLKNLKAIDLNLGLNSIVINEEILRVWRKTLETLSKNVADFSLNIANYAVPAEPKMLSKFVESCGLLKSVSTLKLSVHFSEIETEFYEGLGHLMYRLKSLDSFILQLWTLDERDFVQTIEKNLKKIEEKLSYKAFINWYITSGSNNLDP